MKKKALTVLLLLCVAMAMTACGGNVDTTEVEETAVIAESTEADAQAEADVEEQEETVESEQNESEAPADEEDSEEIVSGDDGTINGDEFPIIEQAVIDNDKSDEYGVYSTSCFDLDEFLNDKGELPGTEDVDNTDWDEYTGRWAYPEITPCQFFENLTLVERSDKKASYQSNDNKTGNIVIMSIFSGLAEYNFGSKYANDSDFTELDGWPKYMFTAQINDGETDVLVENLTYTTGYPLKTYLFTIGNFTVKIWEQPDDLFEGDPIDLSEEDLQLIIDNIHLTTGLER